MTKIAIRTSTGHYVTASNGGGLGDSANELPLHTDAKKPGIHEQFRINFYHDGYCCIQTHKGTYLTAVGGGGICGPDTHPVHTDKSEVGESEKFTLVTVKPGIYAFQTAAGTYLSAVGGGGKGEAANKLPLHTDAGRVGGWERFILVPIKEEKALVPLKAKKKKAK
jgi:hypothetical protein